LGFGLTKFGPTTQPASVQPSEATARERRIRDFMFFLIAAGAAGHGAAAGVMRSLSAQ
jgi:hypothetical protein